MQQKSQTKKTKREYPYGFYIIDNRIMLFGLKPIELAVYNCLCRHGNEYYLSHLRMATIANESGCGVSSAREAVHSLEAMGLVSISPDFKDAPDGIGKWFGANYYRVLDLPDYVRRDAVECAPRDGERKNTKVKNKDPSAEMSELPF